MTLRNLADQIADISTVSSLDTLAVLEGLLKIIPREIAKGNIVELGDLGSFRVRIKSEGSDTAEEVNATNIVNILPHFVPGKLFKKTLRMADFEKGSR